MRIIKNVVKIEVAPMASVGVLRVVCGCKVTMDDHGSRFEEICIKRPGKCVVSVKEENGETVFTSELTFDSAEIVPNRRCIFRFTCADGSSYLVGLTEKPAPQTLWTDTFPDVMTASSLRAYKVTWTGKYPALLII